MSLPKYLEYKDSGVDWLGLVPQHWKISPLKNLAQVVNGYPFDSKLFDANGLHPLIRIRDLNKSETTTRYNGAAIPSAIVTSTDVLVGMDGDFNVGRWLGAQPALLNQRMCCIRANSKDISTLLLHALEIPLKAINDVTYSTTVKHLSSIDVEKIRIALPTDDIELSAIATFLDRETAKIDALIAEQEKLIALLAEKRRATISHAVTRGLNLDVPMKDAGVAWLGEVPAHWTVTPLKHLVKLRSGGTPSKENPSYWNGEIPWASAKDLKVDRLASTAMGITNKALEQGAATLIDAGAVLVVVRGMILARTFPVVETLVPMTINQDLKALIPRACLRNDFLAWLLRGTADESLNRLDEAGHGTKALRMDTWTSMHLPVPPIEEQEHIAAYLLSTTEKLEKLSRAAEHAISLLNEHRSALIAAAVTGQIDVRNSVARFTAEKKTEAI